MTAPHPFGFGEIMMKTEIAPKKRLVRMQKMFAKTRGILVEDYEHFTRQGGSIPLNKVARKSAKPI
jgi:hypothetical protein